MRNVLQIKYHPSQKEVVFFVLGSDGQYYYASEDSVLHKYEEMRGDFIIQDFGNDFISDIVEFFQSTDVEIEAVMTELDYDDFIQMVDYYNYNHRTGISVKQVAILPNMAETYIMLKKYGDEVINLLEVCKGELTAYISADEAIRQIVKDVIPLLEDDILNISEKIRNMRENTINICFSGVYSAGKSALINALLGYKILPENIMSQTAKLYRIVGIRDGEPVGMMFYIRTHKVELEWNSMKGTFDVRNEALSDPIYDDMIELINELSHSGALLHDFIRKLIEFLNQFVEVSTNIDIFFNINMQTDNCNINIFDSPGTDSNRSEHQKILKGALEKQHQSILVFVIKPDGLEGEGNHTILEYLDEIDVEGKNGIDVGRSLFVINKADSISSSDRVKLQNERIRNKNNRDRFISLQEKKLFFTSAKYGYAARAAKNQILSAEDKSIYTIGAMLMVSEPIGYCYRQNKVAMSELATDKMIQESENRVNSFPDESPEVLEACTGIYALENEIRNFCGRYASVVGTYALINSINRSLAKLNNLIDFVKECNETQIAQIEESIQNLKVYLGKVINSKKDKFYKKEYIFEPRKLKKLGLDDATINDWIVGSMQNFMDKELKGWFFGLGKVRVNVQHTETIQSKIAEVVGAYTSAFKSKKEKLFREEIDTYIEEIKSGIKEKEGILDNVKDLVLEGTDIDIKKINMNLDIESIYDAYVRAGKFIIFQTEYLDKEGFIQDATKKIETLAQSIKKDYTEEYQRALETVLDDVNEQFKKNLQFYSTYVSTLSEKKNTMLELNNCMKKTSEDIANRSSVFRTAIWQEKRV